MTLSAMTGDGRCFNPSVLIAGGRQESAVVQQMRILAGEGLYCPHCYQQTGQRLKVGFRNPENRKKHFFHLESLDGERECKSYSNESEKHLAAKAAIAQWLIASGGDVKLEHQLSADDGSTRRPDILCKLPNGLTEAHEIQISYLNPALLQQRTHDLLRMGADQVIWYLYGKSYCKENREFCAMHSRVSWFRLQIPPADIAAVTWKPGKADQSESKRQSKTPDSDRCGRGKQGFFAPSQSQIRYTKPKKDLYALTEGDRNLCQWIQSINPNSLPYPLQLHPGVTLNSPKAIEVLQAEAKALLSANPGNAEPGHPRQIVGAITKDLKALHIKVNSVVADMTQKIAA